MSITPMVVTFDGVDIAARLSSLGAGFRVLAVEGAGLLGAEVVTERQPGFDGSRLVDSHLPERVVTVGFTLRSAVEVGSAASESQSDAERELNGLLSGTGLAPLELSHIAGWHFMAKAGGVRVRTRAAHYLEGELSFVCPSPVLREDTPTEVGVTFDTTVTLTEGNTVAYPAFRCVVDTPTAFDVTVGDVTVTVDASGVTAGNTVLLDWDRMRFSELDPSGARVASMVGRMSTFDRSRLVPGEATPVGFTNAGDISEEYIIKNARLI